MHLFNTIHIQSWYQSFKTFVRSISVFHVCLVCSKNFVTHWTTVWKWVWEVFWLHVVPDMSFVLGVGTNTTAVATLSIANNILVKIFRAVKESLNFRHCINKYVTKLFFHIHTSSILCDIMTNFIVTSMSFNIWITF